MPLLFNEPLSLVGLVTLAMALLSVDVVSTLIADPVISGYTTAAAFLIAAAEDLDARHRQDVKERRQHRE